MVDVVGKVFIMYTSCASNNCSYSDKCIDYDVDFKHLYECFLKVQKCAS